MRYLIRQITMAVIATFALSGLANAGDDNVGEFSINKEKTVMAFSVRQMMVKKINGKFMSFDGAFRLDRQGRLDNITAVMDVSSVKTDSTSTDENISGPMFFDAEKYPVIRFVSKEIIETGSGYKVTGGLTIKGVTREVILTGKLVEKSVIGGHKVVALDASGEFNRKDFNVSFGGPFDFGGLIVSDIVKISAYIEGSKRSESVQLAFRGSNDG